MSVDYKAKYLQYKMKYLNLKNHNINQTGGGFFCNWFGGWFCSAEENAEKFKKQSLNELKKSWQELNKGIYSEKKLCEVDSPMCKLKNYNEFIVKLIDFHAKYIATKEEKITEEQYDPQLTSKQEHICDHSCKQKLLIKLKEIDELIKNINNTIEKKYKIQLKKI
jgi:hypothetical protein